MRGMSEAVWELGKCHNPTLGAAKEKGEIGQHSLSLACLLEGTEHLIHCIKYSRFFISPKAWMTCVSCYSLNLHL